MRRLADLPPCIQDGFAMVSFLTKLGWPLEMIGIFVSQPVGKDHRCVCASLRHPDLGPFNLTVDAPDLDPLDEAGLVALLLDGMAAWNSASMEERERVYQQSTIEGHAVEVLMALRARGFPPTGPGLMPPGGDA